MRNLCIAVGITSCPREPDTYKDSLESIREAGFAVDHVSFDHKKILGSYGNFRDSVKTLLGAPNIDAVLIFQDDIQVSKNLAKLKFPPEIWNENTGVISLYTSAQTAPTGSMPGWHKLNPCQGSNFFGALAILMPTRIAQLFLQNPPQPWCLTMTDFWLGEFCKNQGLDAWHHFPSFARHTGKHSAICGDLWPVDTPYRNCAEFCEDVENLPQ